MREILTIIACLLVALLTAALVGPYFVNWTAQRSFIEQRLSQATGASVHIAGAIDLTLLPTPALRVENLSASSLAPGGPSLKARRVDFELAVAPLLRGEIQFMRADIDAPRLRLPVRSDGAVSLPGAPSELPRKLEFEHVKIHDATIVFDRGGAAPAWSVKDLDLDAQADSLDGPFSGSGQIGGSDGVLRFQFSTGVREGDRLPVAMSVDSTPENRSAQFEGALSFTPTGAATAIAYTGSGALTGTARVDGFAAIPWRIAGDLTADGAGAKLAAGQVRFGDDQRGLSAKAQGSMSFAPQPMIRLALNAQQMDLDSFLAGQGPTARQKWTQAFGAVLSDASFGAAFPWPITLSLDSPGVIVGGETLTGVKTQFAFRQDSPAQLALAMAGPGGFHLAINGSLETGPAAVLRGHVDVGAKDIERLAKWTSPEFPDFSARLKALPFQALALAGDLDLSGASFAIRHLVLTADRTTLRGSAAYTRAFGVQRARLFADMRSDALDLDALPDLSGSASNLAGMDLALSLDARAVRLARFGQGVVDAGRIAVRLTRNGSDLQLEKLAISDVGGASFSATGAADAKGANLDATLDATRLADLAALMNRVAPGPFASALAARATALSPAHLALHLRAVHRSSGDFRPTSVSLTGTARGVQVSGELVPDAADPRIFGLDLGLQGADSSIILRQLGLETLPIADSGKGRIEARLRGRLDQELSARVDASLAGSDLTFQGKIAGGFAHPSARGRLEAKSGDAVPLLRLMTVVLPDASLDLPAAFASDLQADGGALSLSSISGEVGGARVSGTLRLTAAKEGPRIAGALAIDRMSLATLTSLAFGPSQPVHRGAVWSNAPLASGLADPPVSDVALTVDQFALAPAWTARKAAFHLEIEPGVLSLDDMSMKLADGALLGALTLRRNGRAAAIAGKLSADGISIDLPFFSGRLTGGAQFTATGESALGLAQGLAGSGSLTVSNLVMPRTDPGALARVVAMSDKQGFTIDPPTIEAALSSELDKGPLRLASRAFDLSAAAGVIALTSAPPGAKDAQDARADVSLALNLRALQTDGRVSLSDAAAPKDWPEPDPPGIVVRWKGSLTADASTRTIEAGGAIGDLSARAIARETARIGALEADIRERAFFNRRLKGLRFMHRREREVAAYEAEQARRAKAAADAARHAKQRIPTAASVGDATGKPADSQANPSTLVPAPLPPPAPTGLGSDPLSSGLY